MDRRLCAIYFVAVALFGLFALAGRAVQAESPATVEATKTIESAKQVRASLADNALFRYVAKPDDNYSWKVRREGKIGEASYVELTLTSQVWHGITWKHQLFIIKPSTLKADVDHAVLVIEGGRWRAELEKPAEGDDLPREAPLFAQLAEHLQAPLAVLLQVPQQPIFDGKTEDAIIAYTFEQFLRTGQDDWPLLLPMTKSAVRGMDAVSEFAAKAWSLKLETFTVSGASKRGWTTWLTGAVDPRVTAIAPMVIDVLNMQPQMKLHLSTWGEYSDEIHDYTERGLQKYLSAPEGKKLRAIIDPYSFRQAIQQPKLIILGTNDPYWPLDALKLYWDGLVGEKYVLYVPNNAHGLNDYVRVLGSIVALNKQAQAGAPLPKLDWQFENGESKLRLSMQTDTAAKQVRVWMARSNTRDFRQSRWFSLDIPATEQGGSEYALDVPEKGYVAMFGEWQFEGEAIPYFLSTNVRIATRDGEAADGAEE